VLEPCWTIKGIGGWEPPPDSSFTTSLNETPAEPEEGAVLPMEGVAPAVGGEPDESRSPCD
jgi:hypothetical protein